MFLQARVAIATSPFPGMIWPGVHKRYSTLEAIIFGNHDRITLSALCDKLNHRSITRTRAGILDNGLGQNQGISLISSGFWAFVVLALYHTFRTFQ
jgi:hypothetical protein